MPETQRKTKPVPCEHLDKIYAEASQWLRMANTLVWTSGTILVPTSLAPFGFLDKMPTAYHRIVLMAVSLLLVLTWIGITWVYMKSTRKAREVLCAIELEWKLPVMTNEEKVLLSYNKDQMQALDSGWRIFKIQILFSLILATIWLVVLIGSWQGLLK